MDRKLRVTSDFSALRAGCLVVLGACFAGCSGGSMTSELAVKPEAHSISKPASSTIRLPKDEKYSIALAPAQKSPGLSGSADATAEAGRDGNANLIASVENGGTASATFQLGHAFTNETDRQMDLHIRLRFDYEYSAAAKPLAPSADGVLGVDVFARSTRGKLLKTIPVLNFSTAEGDVSSRGSKEAEFAVTLSPADGAIIFVGGNVQIATKDGHSANGAIKLTKLEMEIEPKAAPAVSAATKPAAVP